MEYNRKLIGSRLKQYRVELGFDQAIVAQACNIKQPMLSKFENSGIGGIDILLDLLNFYSKSFNVTNLLHPNFTLLYKDKPDESLDSYKAEVAYTFDEFETTMAKKMAQLKVIVHGSNLDN